MAINTNWYTMDGKLGVNLNKVITSLTATNNPSQPEYPGLPHKLGDRVQGNNGSEWVFVQASATVSAFNFIRIGRNFMAANMPIAASISATNSQYVYGIAQFQLVGSASVGAAVGGVANTGEFFWALIKANGGARLNLDSSISAAAGNKLYVDASTPGWVTTSVTTSINDAQIFGLVLQASVSGADTGVPGAAEVAMFSYPFPAAIVSMIPTSV